MKTLDDNVTEKEAAWNEIYKGKQRWIFWDWAVVIVFFISIVANFIQYCENKNLKAQSEGCQNIINDLEILYRLK